jgi:hypothetical protein
MRSRKVVGSLVEEHVQFRGLPVAVRHVISSLSASTAALLNGTSKSSSLFPFDELEKQLI